MNLQIAHGTCFKDDETFNKIMKEIMTEDAAVFAAFKDSGD